MIYQKLYKGDEYLFISHPFSGIFQKIEQIFTSTI